MSNQQGLAVAMGSAVSSTMNSAEEIHKKIAGVPIDVLETLRFIEEPLEEVRRVQDGIITGIYDFARGINDEVTRAASRLTEGRERPTPKVTAKSKRGVAA